MCELAKYFDEVLPDSAEKSAGMLRLLRAKDALARAALSRPLMQHDHSRNYEDE